MSETKINWYPGHMAKTRRQLEEQMKRVDAVIEICDARLPFSSRNPDLSRMIRGKKHLLVLNKADLADEQATQAWLRRFREEGLSVSAINSIRMARNTFSSMIRKATEDITARAAERGIRKTIKAMVCGVPNVGKSTLINSLKGASIAQTGDRPGVTKSTQWIKIDPYLELMDTPGMLWPRLDDQEAARRLCYIGAIKDDVIDLEALAAELLKDLSKASPESLEKRFRIDNPDLDGPALMDAACKGRGWLLKGGEYDWERASHVILDEFRSGRMGRITLEK